MNAGLTDRAGAVRRSSTAATATRSPCSARIGDDRGPHLPARRRAASRCSPRDGGRARPAASRSHPAGLFAGASPAPCPIGCASNGPARRRRPRTPTASACCSASSTCICSPKAGTSSSASCSARMRWRWKASPACASRVWAPNARRVSRRRRLQRLGRPAPPDAAARRGRRLGILHPALCAGATLQVRAARRPMARCCR